MTLSFGFSIPAVPVTVTGSPGNTEVGFAEQASVIGGGGAIVPTLNTTPALKRAMLKFPRPTG